MSDVTFTCDECGSTIYQEHIQSGIARRRSGRLLCSFCLSDSGPSPGGPDSELVEPIAFEEDDGPIGKSSSTVMSAMGGSQVSVGSVPTSVIGAGKWDETRFKRPLDPAGAGGSRCRIFHSKLNDGAIAFMLDQINQWLDEHKDITVKFSTSTMGVFEGKHADPNLILTVFY